MSSDLSSQHGSLTVRQYWTGLLASIASSFALLVAISLIAGIVLAVIGAGPEAQVYVAISAAGLVTAYLFLTQLAVNIKRCHAVGRSGWWCLVLLVPLIGPLWLLLDLSTRRTVEAAPAV